MNGFKWPHSLVVELPSPANVWWLDGQYLHNAKEDAAEKALKTLVFTCTQSTGIKFAL
jgi:hypothetical protein